MEKTGVQFRISGKAAVLPNKPEEKSALEKILKETLHAKGEEATPEYWVNKRSEEFEKMSGHLRATFARPPPGTPLEDLKEGEKPGDWSESIKPPGEDVSRDLFPLLSGCFVFFRFGFLLVRFFVPRGGITITIKSLHLLSTFLDPLSTFHSHSSSSESDSVFAVSFTRLTQPTSPKSQLQSLAGKDQIRPRPRKRQLPPRRHLPIERGDARTQGDS
jgi:hypothetical protein